ncbi:unnamed protein product [Caenorhabditis sp. 36 PRJEB53466]|nr:unnamed protein product [Caenorhabditis sp. 36 PRJEB53466]
MWILVGLLLVRTLHATQNKSLASNPKCQSLTDCPTGYSNCSKVHGINGNRCIRNVTQLCTGGVPNLPFRPCTRMRDCTDALQTYQGWCDYETKLCCGLPADSEDPMTCPDRLTPLYGQEKCTEVEKGMVYSGNSKQKGGLCYKGYSCPPKITNVHDMAFGSMTFRTNVDCLLDRPVGEKYSFMFCHNETGNLWVIGQLNVNGDEVRKHWTQCQLNEDCGKGFVCVKEDLCRYRCYEDPTEVIDYDSIILQVLAMFLLPLIFLASVIFLTVKYLD